MSEQTFSTAFSTVKQLAEDFQANEQSYLDAKYSEAQARLDYIDKFWIALGWDVNHEREKNPYEQEVKVERGVAVSNRLKKADYAFFAAPNFRDVKFYVEAKKPSRNLDNADDYFQTLRYGWSSKTPIAVLTDFEQFRVIDCRSKPNIATAQNFAFEDVKFNYRDYADEEKFRRIYHLFSRESVLKGSIEDYAKSLPKRGKGKQKTASAIQKSVDESFLDDLDGYRAELARAFKNKNPELDGEELTEAVTRTIDRLVFIRFLEDKLIEPDTMIDKFASWADFVRTSARLNSFYNGVVFKRHFIDKPDFNADEKVFRDICSEFSPQDSPYNFNYIPVHILGSIYERFLGKIIVATDKRATVQEKPEVRKASGVYYTPEYIVRYIVENTIGKLLNGTQNRSEFRLEAAMPPQGETQNSAKTPADVKEMHFADIACGSGSFLLGVYDYLLRWHTDYYNSAGKKGEARTAGCIENADGSFTLSIAQRREILRNNVFGVDVDAQATEVAQLSLALKLLEDATTATTRAFQPKLGEKLLPDMTGNIVCGNSLVDWDILDGQLFERNEERKLNPMSYEDKFPEIMRGGGFDAIVGNPPYIRIQTMQENVPMALGYFKRNYDSAAKGNYDIYVVFVEQALRKMNQRATLGYILPHKFFNAKYGEPLRGLLAKGKNLSHIVHFGDQQVFDGATTYTALLFANKAATEEIDFVKAADLSAWREDKTSLRGMIQAANVTASDWNFTVGENSELFGKLNKMPFKLGDVATKIFQGLVTGADSVFILQNNSNGFFSEATQQNHALESELLHPLCKGSVNLRRYEVSEITKSILFPYSLINGKAELLSEKLLKDNFPNTWQYLQQNRTVLESRERGKWKHSRWYALGRSQNLSEMEQSKILTPSIAKNASFTFDETDFYYFVGSGGGGGGGYGILLSDETNLSYKYVLGLLNSKLLNKFLKSVSSPFSQGYYAFNKQYIEQLPIRTINFDETGEKAAHDKMVSLVEQMLEMKKHLQAARTDKDKTFYQGRCNALDRQIDKLVYDLYALTPDEINIVEGAA